MSQPQPIRRRRNARQPSILCSAVTTASHVVGPPTVADVSCDPEFVDAKGARSRFGLTKSYLYILKDEGLITSVSWRRRGATRGRRLFSCDSIREFLWAHVDPPKKRDCAAKGVASKRRKK